MFQKLVLFLFFTCIAVQGYPSSLQESEIDIQEIRAIWDQIKDIIDKIKNAITNFINNFKDIIKKIEDKIKEILGGLDLQAIIEKIKNWLKNKLGHISEKVQECIDEQNDNIKQLANDIKQDSLACVNAAKNQILTLKDDATKFAKNIYEIVKQLGKDAAKCLVSGHIRECLNGVYEQAKVEFGKVEADAAQLVNKAKEVVMAAGSDLAVCMKQVASTAQEKEQVILDNIEKCVISKNTVQPF